MKCTAYSVYLGGPNITTRGKRKVRILILEQNNLVKVTPLVMTTLKNGKGCGQLLESRKYKELIMPPPPHTHTLELISPTGTMA